MRRTSIVLAAAVMTMAALTGGVSSAGVTHTESATYYGSFDPLSPAFCDETPENIGEVCFDIKPGDKRVDITMVDVVNPLPGFAWRLLDANMSCATPTADGLGCDSLDFGCPTAANITIPSNAKILQVMPMGVILGPLVCNGEGETSPGTATTGTITAKFKD